jgi:hypothetical protein
MNPLLVNGQQFLGSGLWAGCVKTSSIASLRLGEPLLWEKRESSCVTMRKLNCSTCSLDGTWIITVRGLLVDCRPVRFEDSYWLGIRTEWRGIRLPVEGRTRLRESPVKEIDTRDRQKTAEEGITKKDPGGRTQDREDKVSSLCCVTNNCSSARWKSK